MTREVSSLRRPALSRLLVAAVAASAVVAAPPAYADPVGLVATPGGDVLDLGSGARCQVPMDEVERLCDELEADAGQEVSYRAEPVGGYQFQDWRVVGGGPVPCEEASGATTWSGTVCSFVVPSGGVGLKATFTDTEDPAAPQITGPTGPVNQPPSFLFADPETDPTFRRFRCTVTPATEGRPVREQFGPCDRAGDAELGHTAAAPATSGEYKLWVLAEDWRGNVSYADLTWTYDIDADTKIVDRPPKLTKETLASFAFESPEVASGFRCRLDGRSIPCASFRVGNGTHTFTVATVDLLGNVDPSPASYTWRVDTVRPRVKQKAPTGRRVARSATVTVVFSEAMNKSTVAVRRGKPASVYLLRGHRKVAATVRYVRRGGAYRAVLDPTRRLAPRTAYRVVVTDQPRDLARNFLRPTSWRFRTR